MSIFKKKPKSFFSPSETERIVNAIKEAEMRTSGEIKVHVESQCELHPMDRATEVFAHLEMHLTRMRNGVLLYISIEDRKFAILADEGINEAVTADFWDGMRTRMESQLRQGNLVEGIVDAVLEAGIQLKAYFPYNEPKNNEISDDLSLGD